MTGGAGRQQMGNSSSRRVYTPARPTSVLSDPIRCTPSRITPFPLEQQLPASITIPLPFECSEQEQEERRRKAIALRTHLCRRN
jgi:hypothetical protein